MSDLGALIRQMQARFVRSVEPHRVFDTLLPDLKQPTKAKLEEAMKGHIIREAQLVGTYQKGG